MSTFALRLYRLLRRFGAAEEGTIALIFGIALFPVISVVGAAIDYSRANAIRTDMQAAIDSTALMVSKIAITATKEELQAKASAYFAALFNRPEATGSVTAAYDNSDGFMVTINGTVSFDTLLMGLVGYKKMDMSAESVVKWGNTRLRVALALDVTGSMASAGKMPALKTAATNLLTQLKNAAYQNGDVHVSIVPFAKDVNVGATNHNQDWINWSLWDARNGSCSRRPSRNNTKSECEDDNGTWTPAAHTTWNGCVTDRDQNYDTTNTAPSTATPATLFRAEQYNACPTSIMGLSYDWTSLNQKIDALSSNGGTNQVIGLQWAFQSLTSAPFTIPPKDPKYQYKQVIILMSDGLNTQNRWYGNGSTYDSRIDARQAILCDNVKAAGIIIYTVQVNTDGDPLQTVMRNCASSSEDKFFMLTSASQMVSTFQQIGTQLSDLRIAK